MTLPLIVNRKSEIVNRTASLFTGGAGFETGAMLAGCRPLWGVEIRPDIAQVAERNIPGLRVIVSDVANVDYSSLEAPDHLHASPSCKNASVANSDGEEAPEDLTSAMAVCRAVTELRPQKFTLENVWAYRNFESFKLIVGTLTRLGYFVDWWHLNAADYGVPQTRKRLILIARLDRQPRKPAPTHSRNPDPFGLYKPWVGWLESIADLVDGLPDDKFAPWQEERLPAELKTMLLAQGGYDGQIVNRSIDEPAFTVTGNSNQAGVRAYLVSSIDCTIREEVEPANTVVAVGDGHSIAPRAFLVNKSADKFGDGVAYGESRAFTVMANSQGRYKAFVVDCQESNSSTGLTIRQADEPMFTVSASMEPKRPARASIGRVVRMTPRCLARFQSFPDSYILPEPASVEFWKWAGLEPSNGLACEIIGNSVPPLLAKAICESLK